MDNSPWSEGEFWSNLKSSNISKTGEAMPTKIGLHIFHVNLDMHEFFQLILFFDIHGPKGNLAFKKGHKSAKLEKPCVPNLISMHFMSISTCMNFFS